MTVIDGMCIYKGVYEIISLDMEGFKFVTATTVVVGGGCKEARLNLCGLPMHSFHRFIAISLPLMKLKLCFVLDGYERTDNYTSLYVMFTFHQLV